jgi:TolA-binding protein
MGREHSLKTPLLFTIITAALLASTSLVYAIDPNASAALQNANKQAAANAQNMQERITRMEDQIARMNEESSRCGNRKSKINESCKPKIADCFSSSSSETTVA